MATWKLATVYKKSIVQSQFWIKNDITVERITTWRWGELYIESEEEPNIDLSNPRGFDTASADYDIELGDLVDGDSYFDFPAAITEHEQLRLEELWDEADEDGWEEDGWELDDDSLIFNDQLRLTKED
jgi:hypothetical protein